jgi:hypothetical protein
VAVTAGRGDDHGTGEGRTAAAQLAAWAAAQLPPGATLSADPAAVDQLARAGVQAGVMTTVAAATRRDGPQLQVVDGADPAGRSVVAQFVDAAGEQLTVVDPAAVAPDAAELAERRRLGAALLANPTTAAPGTVARRLRAGTVDPRLLTLLAGMASRFSIRLVDLPSVAGEDHGDARAAVVSTTEGADGLPAVRRWLSAQRRGLAPDDVRPVEDGLLLAFRYVSDPDGELTG